MRIAFVITPHMLATSLTNAYELFFAANEVARTNTLNKKKKNNSVIELVKVATTNSRITLPSGLSLAPDFTLNSNMADTERFDMIYLPALWRNPRPIVKQNPEIVEWIRRQYEYGAIINSTGTGVCFIAEAGLLNKKPATTHWFYLEQFAKDYPQIQVKRQHFITSVLTSCASVY